MKFLSFLVILLTINSCSSQIDETISEINYQASTRGNSIQIKITKENVYIKNNHGEKTFVLKEDNWRHINKLISYFKISEIQNLNPPSNLRISDKALHASLEIKTDKKEYRSQDFDHGNPPKEIKKLVEKLLDLAEIKD